jgi:hypothetical protein
MSQIKTPGVGRSKPMHAFGKIGFAGAQQKMVVIAHENIGKYIDIKSLRHLAYSF